MKLKIAVIGSSGCGKTYLCNILGSESSSNSEVVKPPYRPTHSVRILEFPVQDVDVQLWEVGGAPAVKSIWAGVQHSLDGVVLMYDVGKESSVRESGALYMSWVSHSPGLTPSQALLLGNKFRGAAEHGPQRIVGVPPRTQHVALNIEDDPNRLREEFKTFVMRILRERQHH